MMDNKAETGTLEKNIASNGEIHTSNEGAREGC